MPFVIGLPILFALGALLLRAVSAPELSSEVAAHLSSHLLPSAVRTSLLLGFGVVCLSALFAIPQAWAVSVFEYPGRRWLSKLLLIPLAIPSYVLALSALDFFDYTGPLQSMIRETFPDFQGDFHLRHAYGLILCLSFSLYPYLYLLAQEAFTSLGRPLWQTGRILGLGPVRSFFKSVLPGTRPWWLAGIFFIAVETIGDFGTAALFPVETLSTALYKSWFSLFAIDAAIRIAAGFLIVVAILMWLRLYSERKLKNWGFGRAKPIREPRIELRGKLRYLVPALQILFLLSACGLPLLHLFTMADFSQFTTDRFQEAFWNSLQLGLAVAVGSGLLALLQTIQVSESVRAFWGWLAPISRLGYALPGAILALSLFLFRERIGLSIVSGSSGAALVFLSLTLILRFFAVSLDPLTESSKRISISLRRSASLFGLRFSERVRHLYWPELRGSLALGAFLVFVDAIKEVPLVLMSRPSGWRNLATDIYHYGSEGQWKMAALPALCLSLFALIATIVFIQHTGNRHADR